MYIADVMAFCDGGRFNWTLKMLPERSVTMSVIHHLLCLHRRLVWFRCGRRALAWLRCRRGGLGWFPDRAARAQALNCLRVEPQFFENLLVVFADFRRAFRRHFRHTVHLDRTADRGSQLAARALERNDDVIQPQLRVVDHLLWPADGAKRDVDVAEDLGPMGHRLRAENFVEDGRELRHLCDQLGGIEECWIGQQAGGGTGLQRGA